MQSTAQAVGEEWGLVRVEQREEKGTNGQRTGICMDESRSLKGRRG
jgi:hypothetical protein